MADLEKVEYSASIAAWDEGGSLAGGLSIQREQLPPELSAFAYGRFPQIEALLEEVDISIPTDWQLVYFYSAMVARYMHMMDRANPSAPVFDELPEVQFLVPGQLQAEETEAGALPHTKVVFPQQIDKIDFFVTSKETPHIGFIGTLITSGVNAGLPMAIEKFVGDENVTSLRLNDLFGGANEFRPFVKDAIQGVSALAVA